MEDLFVRLSWSPFRQRFHLGSKEIVYIENKGLTIIRQHATDFVAQRLAPSEPTNDGKQTPMHGHPVFIAQHATATCCRACLAKWHGIVAHRPLSQHEQAYVITVIMTWIERNRVR